MPEEIWIKDWWWNCNEIWWKMFQSSQTSHLLLLCWSSRDILPKIGWHTIWNIVNYGHLGSSCGCQLDYYREKYVYNWIVNCLNNGKLLTLNMKCQNIPKFICEQMQAQQLYSGIMPQYCYDILDKRQTNVFGALKPLNDFSGGPVTVDMAACSQHTTDKCCTHHTKSLIFVRFQLSLSLLVFPSYNHIMSSVNFNHAF